MDTEFALDFPQSDMDHTYNVVKCEEEDMEVYEYMNLNWEDIPSDTSSDENEISSNGNFKMEESPSYEDSDEHEISSDPSSDEQETTNSESSDEQDLTNFWRLCVAATTYFSEDMNLSREDKIKNALDLMKEFGMSLAEVTELTKIPKSTLHDHLSGNSRKFVRGRNKKLTDAEEAIIVRELKTLRRKRTFKELSELIHHMAIEHRMRSLINMETRKVGRKWLSLFLKRYDLEYIVA